MNTTTSVLACIDGSRHSEAVVDYASWVARTTGSPLKLLHNLESQHAGEIDLSGSIGLGARENLLSELTELEARANRIRMEQGKLMLQWAEQRALAQGVAEPASLQRHGSLAESLIEMEDEIRVLVMGIRGKDHESREKQIGAQLETVIRSMHRPVLVVNRSFTVPPKEIMLAFDGREGARKGLEMIGKSPLYKDTCCHIVRVGSRSSDEQDLAELALQLETADLQVTTAHLSGDPGPALLEYQNGSGIDMTVMGAFGHSRLREFFFGSTTVQMLGGSTVPLLLLR